MVAMAFLPVLFYHPANNCIVFATSHGMLQQSLFYLLFRNVAPRNKLSLFKTRVIARSFFHMPRITQAPQHFPFRILSPVSPPARFQAWKWRWVLSLALFHALSSPYRHAKAWLDLPPNEMSYYICNTLQTNACLKLFFSLSAIS